MRAACTGQPIPELEARWRSIAASIKSRAAAAGAVVNFINADVPEEGELVSGSEWEEFLAWKNLRNQGKVEGSST